MVEMHPEHGKQQNLTFRTAPVLRNPDSVSGMEAHVNINFWSNFKKGNALAAEHKHKEAAIKYIEAIQNSNENTEHALALEGLYTTSVRAGDIQSGIGYLKRAMDADPNSPHIIRMTCALGAQYARVNAMEDALAIQSQLVRHMRWTHAADAGYNFVKELWFAGNHKTFDLVISALRSEFDNEIRAIEIGSLQGMSACYIADQLSLSGGFDLTCIDPDFQPEFWSNIGRCSAPERVHSIQAKSQDVLSTLPPQSFHLIHIDGLHVAPQVFIDGLLSMRLLAKGGYVIFDDYLKEDQTTKSQSVKAGVKAFWEVFAPWLEVVIDGRQLVCRSHDSFCVNAVISKTDDVLKFILKKNKIFSSMPIDIEGLYSVIASDHMSDFFGSSWECASAFPVPKKESA